MQHFTPQRAPHFGTTARGAGVTSRWRLPGLVQTRRRSGMRSAFLPTTIVQSVELGQCASCETSTMRTSWRRDIVLPQLICDPPHTGR